MPTPAFIVSASALSDGSLRALFAEHAPDAEVRVAWDTEQTYEYARGAVERGADRLIAVGGDGTVNAVAAVAVEQDVALGVVPRGTANDFAFSLGLLDLAPEAQVEIALSAPPRPTDVLRVGERVCVNALSVGEGARITHETPGPLKELLGALGYAVAGVRDLGRVEAFGAELEGETTSWSGESFMIVIGNGRRAGGVRLHPHAELDDGLLDVVVFPNLPDVSLLALAEQVPRLEKGTFEHLEVFQAASLQITLSEPVSATIDGEYTELDRVDVSVDSCALRVAAPEEEPVA